jgi:hypothetical protein
MRFTWQRAGFYWIKIFQIEILHEWGDEFGIRATIGSLSNEGFIPVGFERALFFAKFPSCWYNNLIVVIK